MVGKMAMISSRFISCWLLDLCVKTLFFQGAQQRCQNCRLLAGFRQQTHPEAVTEVLTVQVRVTFLSLESPENHQRSGFPREDDHCGGYCQTRGAGARQAETTDVH